MTIKQDAIINGFVDEFFEYIPIPRCYHRVVRLLLSRVYLTGLQTELRDHLESTVGTIKQGEI